MGFFTTLKAQKAYKMHSKGDIEGARKTYEEAIREGLNVPRYVLSYCILLIRSGEYQLAKDQLVKVQKMPGLTAEQKVQLFIDYSACCYKLGDLNRAVDLLEKQHHKQSAGTIYQTLGYLYVEKYCREKPVAAPAPQPQEDEENAVTVVPTQEELDAQWEEGKAAALAFLQEAVDYDDEDAICLDNLGQFYYRVLGDKTEAKKWFDKAIAIKDGQIDTLWFLSRYDLDNGNTAAAIEKLEKSLEGRFSVLNCHTKEEVQAEIDRLKK